MGPAGTVGAVAANDGIAAGCAAVALADAVFGNTVSAESAEPVALGAGAARVEDGVVLADGVEVEPDEVPRSSHVATAMRANAATATPIIIGIRDCAAFAAELVAGVVRNCIGSDGEGVLLSVRASPSFAKRSSAACTSSIGNAMPLASCETDIGCDSSVNSFLWRTESPAAPILMGSVASCVALQNAAESEVDISGST